MRSRADTLRFALVFALLSVVLGWLFWSGGAYGGSYMSAAIMLTVPVVSAILAAVGFTWRRKIVYVVATLGLDLLVMAAAESTGFHNYIQQQLATASAFPSVWAILYEAVMTTLPFVMLVLFVGRTPSRLWSRAR